MLQDWACPLPGGETASELLVTKKKDRGTNILMIPPLFDEHNKFRRQMIEIMRHLDEAQIDSVLPDLPGWNESLQPLGEQTLASWRTAIIAAATDLGASHILTFRSGAMLAPDDVPGWKYAPQTGARQLRGMIRAAVISAREEDQAISSEELMVEGRDKGFNLAGYDIGAELFGELAAADGDGAQHLVEITQSDVGGRGLWLRAEPDEDPEQAEALARLIVEELATP